MLCSAQLGDFWHYWEISFKEKDCAHHLSESKWAGRYGGTRLPQNQRSNTGAGTTFMLNASSL